MSITEEIVRSVADTGQKAQIPPYDWHQNGTMFQLLWDTVSGWTYPDA